MTIFSEDAINVSTNVEDVMECCNPGNPENNPTCMCVSPEFPFLRVHFENVFNFLYSIKHYFRTFQFPLCLSLDEALKKLMVL